LCLAIAGGEFTLPADTFRFDMKVVDHADDAERDRICPGASG
jgi:hypothetical protein